MLKCKLVQGVGVDNTEACPGVIYKSAPGGVEVYHKLVHGCFNILSRCIR